MIASLNSASRTAVRRFLVRVVLLLTLAAGSLGTAFAQTVTYFHNEIAGTPQVATNAAGAVVWKENYLPYGYRQVADPASNNNKLWFTGKAYDPDTQLSYMGARYYMPLLGRFTGVDPVEFSPGQPHSLNRYAYANNNPYRYVDPDGRNPIAVIGWAAFEAVAWLGARQAATVAVVEAGAVIATGAMSPPVALEGVVAKSAATRVQEIQEVLSPRTQRAVTTAVTETAEGVRVVTSSEGRLRPAQRAALQPGEVAGVGKSGVHAEVNGVKTSKELGLTPTAVAPSRPACQGCRNAMNDAGVKIINP